MILAIDTSGENCGVALWRKELIGFRVVSEKLRHNEVLFTQIKSILTDFDVKVDSLSAVAVSSGPGSFTGLRVGMAAAKGLCWAWKLPFIAVPTLEGLAEAVPPRIKRVLALMPARATEVYWALFENVEGKWLRQTEDQVSDVSHLRDACRTEIFLFGEGYDKHRSLLDNLFAGQRITLYHGARVDALAVSTARLAENRFAEGRYDDLMETEPKYCYAFPRRKS